MSSKVSLVLRLLSICIVVILVVFTLTLSTNSRVSLPSDSFLTKSLISIAAHLGSAENQFRLAELSDIKNAVKWYEKAATQGHEISQFKLAKLYETGVGVSENKKKSLELYLPLAEKDNVEAQTGACRIYRNNKFAGKNYKEAFQWCSEAAAKDYPEAVYILSSFYLFGQGMKNDLIKGTELVLHAQALGSPQAKKFIELSEADCFVRIENDDKRAQSCLILAAMGNPEAQYITGRLYLDGQSFDRDANLSLFWLKKSAEQGLKSSQVLLGKLYALGDDGVKTDALEAFAWLFLAFEGGGGETFVEEEQLYKKLLTELSLDEQRSAQRKAMLFREKYKQ